MVRADEARVLAGYLGIIARNVSLLPINYESWHHMPDSNKNHVVGNIKERFTLEVSDNYVKKALARKWRDHESTLKKEYFKKNISLEEKLLNDRERVGTTSRQKQKFTNTVGSKSFACVADDDELSSGQKVGRLLLFDITHRKKDGSPMTTEVAKIMMQASTVEQIAQLKVEVASREAEAKRKYDELQLQLKVEATAREVKAAAMATEETRKYDELQLQLQNMMKLFQQNQSQNLPS
ncbi:hypothetical protein GOBAR_AA29681 [Gossypium barbadense]|uniref:Uncharacterized protein n=1 Tax=Gossypium barbadense TaxID=3634 RepID=A0A2P5WIV9_GOSBA|nr:hypothetical protein GOBAR_AA29681 [Gossypium barbadense]